MREMLFEQTAEGSPLQALRPNVLTAANRARGLVDQILAYSRSQRGKRIAVDFGRIAAETLELIRGSLGPGMRLEGKLPGGSGVRRRRPDATAPGPDEPVHERDPGDG